MTWSHSDGVASAGQPADHRAEERRPARRLEVQDRRADIAAGERERLLGLRADLVVERGVVERVGQFGGQPGVGQRGSTR